MYIDRVFTLRGLGTVATGTLWSGSIADGDALRAEPAGLDVRVRSVQVHDRPVERAEAGQRVAVTLPGTERTALRRGDALVEPGAYPVSYRLDVVLDELEAIPPRVTVHHGTAAITARVARIGDRFAQLRLAEPVVAARGDRLVLRAATTVGGGRVIDPAPPRHRSAERLELLERGELGRTIHAPVRARALRHLGEPEGVERAGEWLFSAAWLEELRNDVQGRLGAADPLDPGIDAPAEPWAADVVPLLGVERRGSRLYPPGVKAELGEREQRANELLSALELAGFDPVEIDDPQLARYLEADGRLVRIGDRYAVGTAAYERARRLLIEECERAGRITLARFRDLLGASRRPAQLLLERFDADGVTRRIGDERVLRRSTREREPSG